MKYQIQVQEQLIRFEWETGDGEHWEKIVEYDINEKGCFIARRPFAIFKGLGQLDIKEVMGLKCCCNPAHDIFPASEIHEGVPAKWKVGEEKPISQEEKKGVMPTKEKTLDGRTKLTDGEVDMIRQSPKSTSELAAIFKISRMQVSRIKNGKRS